MQPKCFAWLLTTASLSRFHNTRRMIANIPSILPSCHLKNEVYIALGSNLGDRSTAIEQSVQKLKQLGRLKCTSFLYETKPMYHTEQANFFNAVCVLETNLEPSQLLKQLQSIEILIGRTTTFRNGPRVIDLDILLYRELGSGKVRFVSSNELQLPHPRICERAFVLKPLCDIDKDLTIPSSSHPGSYLTVQQLYNNLSSASQFEVKRVNPILSYYNSLKDAAHNTNALSSFNATSLQKQPVIIMGILNITPDSFSDGGRYCNTSTSDTSIGCNNEDILVSAAVNQALLLEKAGASIIDIGGESSRPGAVTVSVEEELQRVLPVISGIRAAGSRCLISIDTRKAVVALQAVQAGANIVNDISAGQYDRDMLATVGGIPGVSYIAMHMRGEPNSMMQDQYTLYKEEDNNNNNINNTAVEDNTNGNTLITDVVSKELHAQLANIDQFIPRWLQIVDPGIGFAKGYNENMALLYPQNLRRFKSILGDRLLLVGISRKRFLKKIVADSISKRQYQQIDTTSSNNGNKSDNNTNETKPTVISSSLLDLATAAGCCAALNGGADILRVHHVEYTRVVCDTFQAMNNLHPQHRL